MNIVPNLNIKTQHEFPNTTDNSRDPIENAIENMRITPANLNIRKAVQSNDIPTKLIKKIGHLVSKYIATNINRCITVGTFVNAFEKAIYKKDG